MPIKQSRAPLNIWNFFVKEETRSSSLLIIAALVALIWANSTFSNSYFHLTSLSFTLGSVTMDLQHWVNEGLMALFFLVVGLEIKRELIDGELKGWRKASFPVIAAIGGMLLPALIYSTINTSPPSNQGWAIPMATDIAIAVAVLGILGRRVPRALRVFLLTLAIVDDIGSIVIIGIFYNQPTNVLAFLFAIILCLGLVLARKKPIWPIAFVVFGSMLWYCLLLAGVSATLAGVVIAFLAPMVRSRKASQHLQMSELAEDLLIPLTSFVIVPLFVFMNAGIALNQVSLASSTEMKVFVGIVLGLFVGKPLGIYLACRLATLFKLAHKPRGVSHRHILGAGMIAGIGFTISLLISDLAFSDFANLKNAAVVAVFTASVLSAVGGVLILLGAKRVGAKQ